MSGMIKGDDYFTQKAKRRDEMKDKYLSLAKKAEDEGDTRKAEKMREAADRC